MSDRVQALGAVVDQGEMRPWLELGVLLGGGRPGRGGLVVSGGPVGGNEVEEALPLHGLLPEADGDEDAIVG